MAQPDALAVPSVEILREIEQRQNEKAREIRERRKQQQQQQPNDRDAAAKLIQKNYRGYRARRTLHGYSLDPDARWVEVGQHTECAIGMADLW